jgi:hypothetical protein
MYKILLFMKRRSDLSMDEFRAYYETQHAPLCRQGLTGVARYVRRYITPLRHPETGAWQDSEFDVITELWFASQENRDRTAVYLSSNFMPQEIVEDEKQLFDRSSFRLAIVDECEDRFDNDSSGSRRRR